MLTDITTETTEFVLIGKDSINGKRLALHPVEDEKIGAEVPFTKQAAQGIFSLFEDFQYNAKTFEGFIPKNVLFAKDTPVDKLKLAWVVKKQQRDLLFSKDNQNLQGTYNLPTLVFFIKGVHLYVYALSDSDKNYLKEDTKLFIAPFYNVRANGSVCMGNVSMNIINEFKTFDKVMKFCENAFFHSIFTHTLASEYITEKYLLDNQLTTTWNSKNLFSNEISILNSLLTL